MAFEMGYISDLDWTPESTFAEVFINNQYNGTYNIVQKVEETNRRVALGDTGYLLEIDQIFRLDPDDVYFETGTFLLNIKEPSLVARMMPNSFISATLSTTLKQLCSAVTLCRSNHRLCLVY